MSDDIRQKVLEWFYNLYKEGRESQHQRTHLEDVPNRLRELDRSEVLKAVNFLVDQKFLKKEKVKPLVLPGVKSKFKLPSQDYFSISVKGIQRIEGDSRFNTPSAPHTQINVEGNVNGVITGAGSSVGDITVNNNFVKLDELKELLMKDVNVSEEDKQDVQGDIETIKAQITKRHPNSIILGAAWDTIKRVSAEVESVTPVLAPIGVIVAKAMGI